LTVATPPGRTRSCLGTLALNFKLQVLKAGEIKKKLKLEVSNRFELIIGC
jgi:hypothetical protein